MMRKREYRIKQFGIFVIWYVTLLVVLDGGYSLDNKELLEDFIAEFDYLLFCLDNLDNPQFDKVGRVHNWRNYVPDAVKSRWPDLSEDAKLITYIIAEVQANREDWD